MSDSGGSNREGGTFVDRLGRLVLFSYAIGQPVEGSWYLVNGHRMVPDVNVTINRTGGGRGALAEGWTVSGVDRRGLKDKLESFVLAEFAGGERIEGTWELRFHREELPTWTVVIEYGEVEFDVDPEELPLRPSGEG